MTPRARRRATCAALTLGLLLTGCTATLGAPAAPDAPTPSPAPSEPAEPATATPSPAIPTDPDSPSSAPLPPTEPDTPEPVVDPDAVAGRFADVTPTEWGLEVSGVRTHLSGPGVALTLDGCGGTHGSGFDRVLIDGLVERGVPATIFLNARWIEANPELAAELAAQPLFELANHGTSHRPLSVTGESAYGIAGTASAAEVVAEVWGNHERLTALTGSPPRWFRSGTAHYDDVATQIVAALGEEVVGFTTNGDAGATFSAAQVEQAVLAAPDGGVVIAHMNQPDGDTAAGLLAAVDRMRAEGRQFVLLDGVTG